MRRRYDVAIVGGGIAGGALAFALSRAGLGVLLLERQRKYRDRILGEGMVPWGVADARHIGLEQPLLENPEGTLTLRHWVEYRMDRDAADVEKEALEQPLAEAVEGVDGILCVRHPVACESIAEAAQAAGATVIRAVRDVEVSLGSSPSLNWSVDGEQAEAGCRLLVGADGKVSTVRRQAGIELREDEPMSYVAGMLAGALDGAPTAHGYSVNEADRFLIAFPQVGDRARLYVCVSPDDRTRFAGASAAEDFLAAWDTPYLPCGATISAGRADGPCATFPLSSAFVDEPVQEGLVLIGDAAGWVDPLIGQGLAMAMRDARLIAEILTVQAAWPPEVFAGYVAERRQRLEILALNARVQQRLDVDLSPDFAPRRLDTYNAVWGDDVFGSLMLAQIAGPEAADQAVLSPAQQDRLRTLLYAS